MRGIIDADGPKITFPLLLSLEEFDELLGDIGGITAELAGDRDERQRLRRTRFARLSGLFPCVNVSGDARFETHRFSPME